MIIDAWTISESIITISLLLSIIYLSHELRYLRRRWLIAFDHLGPAWFAATFVNMLILHFFHCQFYIWQIAFPFFLFVLYVIDGFIRKSRVKIDAPLPYFVVKFVQFYDIWRRGGYF